MALYELDDVFGYQDANEIKRLWAAADDPDPQTTTIDVGEVYLNISTIPCQLKRYNGTAWEIVGVAATEDISGTDLNDLAVTGFYKGNNLTNSPDGTANAFSVLNLQHSAADKTQVAWSLDSNTVNAQYMRNMAGGTWGSWAKVWTGTTGGAGSGLDADKLDGQEGAFYQNAGNLNAGTIPLDRIPATLTGKDADTLDGQDGTFYQNAGNLNAGTIPADRLNAADILDKVKTVDGPGSGLDADTLDGAEPSDAASNSTIVKRTSSGYVYANYFNTTCSDSSSPTHLYGSQDSFIRKVTAAQAVTFISSADGAGSGLDADMVDGLEADRFLQRGASKEVINISSTDLNDLDGTGFYRGSSLTNSPDGTASWFYILHLQHSTSYKTQIAWNLTTNTDAKMFMRLMHNSAWGSWYKVWTETTDGAGSGLDADTLDGLSSASFVKTSGTQTVGGAKTFTGKVTLNYPVIPLSKPSGAVNGTIWIG